MQVLILFMMVVTATFGRNIRCPGNLNIGDVAANPEDSSKFFLCIGEGMMQGIQCDTGLLFNIEHKACEVPIQSETVEWRKSACSDKPNGLVLANLANNCRSFLICEYGRGRETPCGTGYKYNAAVGYCDLERNVVCASFGQVPIGPNVVAPIAPGKPGRPGALVAPGSPSKPSLLVAPGSPSKPSLLVAPGPPGPPGPLPPPSGVDGELECIVTTPPPAEDECTDGVLDVAAPEDEATPAPEEDECVDGVLDVPVELPYCPPGTRC